MKQVTSLISTGVFVLLFVFVGLGSSSVDMDVFQTSIAQAQSLVPEACSGSNGGADCPDGEGAYRPDGYGSCEFVSLVNNVIQFLIKMSALLAVLVFVYAGFVMVSSRGDSTLIAGAKKLFANVLIGFVILLASFLIINTVIGILVGGATGGVTWQTIECQYANKSAGAEDVAIELEVHPGYVSLYTPVVIGTMPSAGVSGGTGGTAGGGGTDGATCDAAGLSVGNACYGANRCQVQNVRSACPRISTYASYINAAAARYDISADRIRGIMITESGGNPNARSPVGALGLMQIMPATARASCGLSASELFDPAKNIDCGARYYATQYRAFGSHDLAAAAYNAGPGRNSASRDCPGLTQWQCPFNSGGCCSAGVVTATSCRINTGFAETRKYVDKVNAASPACRG